MEKQIMIIGGHGHVGKVITRELVKKYPNQLRIAGRNQQVMAAFCDELEGEVSYQLLDLTASINPLDFLDTSLIIMCMDQSNLDLIEFCIESRIDYLDITANSALFHSLSKVPKTDRSNLVFSVGLAPGLSNLAATEIVRMNPTTQRVTIDIMLGLGDSHGEAAINWTLSRMNETYQFANSDEIIESFSEGHLVDYYAAIGKKRAYRFNFPDQHTLRQKYPEISFDTFLGFDSSAVTRGLHYFKKIGGLRFLERKKTKEIMGNALLKNKIGSKGFAVKVTGYLPYGETISIVIYGEKEAVITGRIAAFVADKMVGNAVKLGVQHIDEVCSLEEILLNCPELKQVRLLVSNDSK